ncbi:LuxR C-terminal-related transcriptional regulator [Chitinophaga sancti]|uniref:helix-turn-helix transcriptional regulator n=1 Tax=Chitinophaga sancti TaxID=1004 RepID=UPI002A7550AE|nr:tetratricopeptide repeat protein [Chitinophaga sancti]WPQ63129.1 LuxR C-terminal-related transcriptional regulator [Chitinophaga sancti]
MTQKRIYLILLIVSLCLPMPAYAQSILIDSLQNLLSRKDLPLEDRITSTMMMARITGNKDMKAAIVLNQQALAMSTGLKDLKYRANIFSNLTQQYALDDSFSLATKAMDSALYLARKSGDKQALGLAYYRKGWLHIIEQQEDSATHYFFEALRVLDGQKKLTCEPAIYYFTAATYGDWNDLDAQEKYARLSLSTAMQTQKPDDLVNGYQALGTYLEYKYRSKMNDTSKYLLDSALYCNRMALLIIKAENGRLVTRSAPALLSLNTANMFAEYWPEQKDSIMHYLYMATEYAKITEQQEILANCYGMLSDIAVHDGNLKEAENLLLTAFYTVESYPAGGAQVKSHIMQALANVAEKQGNTAKALKYYKQYVDFYQQAFDKERLSTAKRLGAQYEAEKKDKELQLLQQKASFNNELNFFYISLAIAAILALIFFFRSYHFRLRASLQNQQLLELEKHDTQLQLKLEAEERARLETEQLLMQERQERLQKELLAGALQVEEKNELLQSLQKKITTISGTDPLLRQMDRIITDSRKMDEEFEAAKADFKEIDPEFFNRLQQKAKENLTRLDLKYCSYIRMGLTNKEIASRLAVEAKSIRMARYRLKQKLNLPKEESLDLFLTTLI